MKLSHDEKLEDFVNPYPDMLKKAVGTYEDNYYKLSFVENQYAYNNLEAWWCSLEEKIDFVRGRNVAAYLYVDPTKEKTYHKFCSSSSNTIMWGELGLNFGNLAIVSKLWTRDILIKKGRNVRISAIYPVIDPTGNTNIIFAYLLDGRMSGLDANARWTQNFQGEVITLGTVTFKLQNEVTYRVRPKINYSRGTSITFYVEDSTKDAEFNLQGIGLDVIDKFKKKGRGIGA